MIKIAAAAAALSCAICGTAWAQAEGIVVEPEYRIITKRDLLNPDPLPPTDIYRPQPYRSARREDLATFAWLEFIALSAPVGSRRGEPGGSFAESGFDQDATLVWETYLHRSELFPYSASGAVPPNSFDNPPNYDMKANGAPYNPGLSNYNNLDEVSQIGQNYLFFPGQGNAAPAQTIFQAKVNEVEADYVASLAETSAVSLKRDPKTGAIEATTAIDLPDNTIEVKSAWRPLSSIPESQQYRYHISEVIYYEGTDSEPVAKTGMYALLGLHIIQKTPNYPTFIFATFEHTDILKEPDSNAKTGLYYVPTYEEIAYTKPKTTTFYNGDKVKNPFIRFDVNNPTARPNGETVDLPLGDVTSIKGAKENNGSVQVPVVQPNTTNKEVARVNRRTLNAMSRLPGFDENFVWQYYELKGVQGVPTNNEKAKDFYLANIVVESSQPGIQLFRGGADLNLTQTPPNFTNPRNQANVMDPVRGGETFSVGGCQGCHGVAQTSAGFDFSFLFGALGGVGFAPSVIGLPTQSQAVARSLRSTFTQVIGTTGGAEK